uniref:Uncharacterized protein MANES_04G113700 n=1 Tax=Rhizophora mucronata TaxID=61149 RepID=A0A2P2LX26_RHIMU
MHGNSACLGCYMKPTLITSVERSKGLKTQGQIVKKPSIPEDLWTSSTGNMDNSAAQSQRSISSISTINQTLDPHGGPGSANNTSEFVNHGFLLWNQTRQCWVENKMSGNRPQQPREPKLNTHCLWVVKKLWLCCSWNETYDSLLGSNKPFPQPVPLSEMVDFLVDIWEEERM